MRKHQKSIAFLFVILSYLFPCFTVEAAPKWRTAYFFNPSSATLPIEAVPWNKYTHVIQTCMKPTFSNGVPGIDTTSYGIDNNKAAFVNAAHINGVKALITLTIGGGAEATTMEINTSSTHIASFVSVLTEFVNNNNYDGIDIDWEGYSSIDSFTLQFPDFITKLRAAMPTKVITLAGSLAFRNIYAAIYDKVDQINFMCYDLDGSCFTGLPTIRTWFNTCVLKGANQTFGNANNNKSQEEYLWYLSLTTIPAGKIGLGIPFYGRIKQGLRKNSSDGVTSPEQEYASGNGWTNPRTAIGYQALLSSAYWTNGIKMWDDNYKAPYISYNVAGYANDAFVTYPSQQQMEESVKLTYEKNLGGIMVFALHYEYIPSQSGDNRYPLSIAVYNSMRALNPDVNIAYGKPATQSSTFSAGGAATRAVDGNTDGNYWNGSVTHTDTSGTNAWWQVDLGDNFNIGQMKIWNRTDAAMARLSRYFVSIFDGNGELVWFNFQTNYPNPSTTLTPGGIHGRYVNISGPDILSLAEVQVFEY
jgi:GH18 family chitinase